MEEGHDIIRSLNKYKKENNHYPDDLQTVISGSPIRARWSTDAWGQSYHYEISSDKKTFTLISKGKDKILGTTDDIIFE